MNKTVIIIAGILSLTSVSATDLSNSTKVEVFNFLNNNLNIKNEKREYATKKYDFSNFSNQHVFSKTQVLDILRVLDLYQKNENTAGVLVLNSMIKPIEQKYIKLFEFLLKINDALDHNHDVKPLINELIRYDHHDYFFINEVSKLLDRAGKFKEGIVLFEGINKIKNNFLRLSYRKILIYQNPEINKTFQEYLKINKPFIEMQNRLAYFYQKDNRLLDSYNLFSKYNKNKRNSVVIAELYAQITFRVHNFTMNQYSTSVVNFNEKINNTKPFFIYKIDTK